MNEWNSAGHLSNLSHLGNAFRKGAPPWVSTHSQQHSAILPAAQSRCLSWSSSSAGCFLIRAICYFPKASAPQNCLSWPMSKQATLHFFQLKEVMRLPDCPHWEMLEVARRWCPHPKFFCFGLFHARFPRSGDVPGQSDGFPTNRGQWTELKSSPFIQWFMGLKMMLVTFMRKNFTLARASHIHSRFPSAYKSEIWDSLWSRKERQKAVLSGSSAAEPSAFIACRSFHLMLMSWPSI